MILQALYSLGARRIGVCSLAPLGCLPAVIRVFGHGSKACVTRFNEDAMAFNQKLNHTILAISKKYTDLRIAVFDVYRPVYDLVTAPSKQGK
jgi:phospholipase/lecithinase/hemolysin